MDAVPKPRKGANPSAVTHPAPVTTGGKPPASVSEAAADRLSRMSVEIQAGLSDFLQHKMARKTEPLKARQPTVFQVCKCRYVFRYQNHWELVVGI